MQLQIWDADGVSVVELPARLLTADVPSVRACINELIDSGRHRVVLDLNKIGLIDSSGLSVLISARKKAKAHGGDVVLANPSEDVCSLLEVTRMQQLFAIFGDRDAAVATLG
jgi:anti-sigma B factor antagonist